MSDTKSRRLTCIICPKGCEITVTLDNNGSVLDVTGHTCRRGDEYARAECTHPVRTLTTTVRSLDGGVYPVKTSGTIPKELLFDAMRIISEYIAPDNCEIGDVIIPNILDTGADVVITGAKSR